MRRRAIPWALAAALTSIAFDVGAEPTKAECVAAHEQGQRLSKAGRIREAVGVLGQCALETCPSIISRSWMMVGVDSMLASHLENLSLSSATIRCAFTASLSRSDLFISTTLLRSSMS